MKDKMRFNGKRENELHEDLVRPLKMKQVKGRKGFDLRDLDDDDLSFLRRSVKKSSLPKRVNIKSLEDDDFDGI